MLGLTIETVSRKLGELEDMGAIRREGKRGIVLRNQELLHEISGR
jgi:CRP/FNR family transcriptional regulator